VYLIKRFALEDLKSGKPLSGKDGILTPLVKKLTEAALEAELDYHLSETPRPKGRGFLFSGIIFTLFIPLRIF
jgi:hypothetical protein